MADQRLVMAGDRETEEEYLAQVLDDLAHGHSPKPRPIVRVLRCARYPDQRCIAHPEIPLELPAIPAGTVCRLDVIREAGEGDRALLSLPEEEAALRAIDRAISDAASQAEREILLRHRAGEARRKRIMITFDESDLEYLQKCEECFSKKRMKKHAEPHH